MERDLEYEYQLKEQILEDARLGREPPNYRLTSKCTKCAHLFSSLTWTCAAYPRGIPHPFLTGVNSHHSPYDGDNGLQFKPIELPEDQYLPQPLSRRSMHASEVSDVDLGRRFSVSGFLGCDPTRKSWLFAALNDSTAQVLLIEHDILPVILTSIHDVPIPSPVGGDFKIFSPAIVDGTIRTAATDTRYPYAITDVTRIRFLSTRWSTIVSFPHSRR